MVTLLIFIMPRCLAWEDSSIISMVITSEYYSSLHSLFSKINKITMGLTVLTYMFKIFYNTKLTRFAKQAS